FAVPVVCTNNPIISVNAEESEQDTHDDNEEEVTDEYYSEEDYSEEEYSDEEYFEEEYSDEEYFEEDYFDDEYFEEDDMYDIEETTPQEEQTSEDIESIETYNSSVSGSGKCGENATWILEDGILTIKGSGELEGYVNDTGIADVTKAPWYQYAESIKSVVIESGITNLNYGFIGNCPNLETVEFSDTVKNTGRGSFNNCPNLKSVVFPESVESIERESFGNCDNLTSITIMNNKVTIGNWSFGSCENLDVYFNGTEEEWKKTFQEMANTTLAKANFHSIAETTTSTTTSTGTTTETTTTTTTTTKEPAITYEWYVEPSVKADDINTVGVFMESISHDNDDYEYNYGRFADTGYAIVKDGDFYGVIDMNGNVVIETDYVLIRGAINDHFRLYDEEGKYTYFCCETGEYLDPQEPYCAWCERTLLSDVCSSYYCYDPDRDLLAYIGVMPKSNNEEESITLNGQNSSGTTIDFPEGKTIPVRMVSIESDDEVILYDSYGIMRDGEIIVDFNYDNALSYKDGITAVEQDGEWYYYDEDGYQIIEDSCEGSYYFNINNEDYIPYLPSEEYIAFNTAWGGGYYSTDGGVVIPVGEFAEARPVFNGLAWVKDHATGLWGVIQLTGERADAPENNDDNSDSEEDGDENNSSNSSSNNSSSSSGSNGKAAPKTGDDFGNVFALLALSLGVMVVSMKRREK
ncbi:MAG: leucine-rich repeat protein, partial [Ruminococcus sp.]|nr:leucine-rich repeat protein [Ruminococcus sp.]